MIITRNKIICKIKTNNLNIQSQTIQSHKHTIAHTHIQQGTFNTDEKGGHTHTTNSQSSSSFRTSTKIYNSSNTEITNTQEMSGSTYAHIRCFDLHDGSVQGRASILSGWTGGTSEGIDGGGPYQKNYLNIDLSHNHNMQHNHTVDISHTHGTDSQGAHTHSVTISGSTKGSSNADSGSTGSVETRPDNYSYVIWKRIA